MKFRSRRTKNTERIEHALRLLKEGRLEEGALAFRRIAGATATHAVERPEPEPRARWFQCVVQTH